MTVTRGYECVLTPLLTPPRMQYAATVCNRQQENQLI